MGITPIVGNKIYGSCVLHVVSSYFIFVKSFKKTVLMVFNLHGGHRYMTEITIYSVQRVRTQSRKTRVMVLVFCTSADGTLYFLKVS